MMRKKKKKKSNPIASRDTRLFYVSHVPCAGRELEPLAFRLGVCA